MVAIDTNIIVRLVTNDDPVQASRAATLVTTRSTFIPKTVLLETEWVLRHAYAIDRAGIVRAMRGVLGLQTVSVEDPRAVAVAIDWFERGMDFADALHLASSERAGSFATFDLRLIASARRLGAPRIESP